MCYFPATCGLRPSRNADNRKRQQQTMNRFRRLVGRPWRRVNRATSFKAGRIGLAGAAALSLGLGVAACGGDSSGTNSGQVNLIAYSTPESVYDGALIPGFEKTSEGGD